LGLNDNVYEVNDVISQREVFLKISYTIE